MTKTIEEMIKEKIAKLINDDKNTLTKKDEDDIMKMLDEI